MGECLGVRYLRYFTHRLGVLAVVIFVRRSLIWFLTGSPSCSTFPFLMTTEKGLQCPAAGV